MPEITAIWLRGGENEVDILVEHDGQWRKVITEHMPLHGNDEIVWPISHIVEKSLIENAPIEEIRK